MRTAPVHRYVWELVPAPPLPVAGENLKGRRVAVIGGTEQMTQQVIAELNTRGAVSWRLGDAGTPDAVVDLTLPEPFDPDDPDAFEQPLLHTLAVLRHCYSDWVAEIDARRIGYLAVTYLGGHAGYGERPIYQPLSGIWAGLAKTLHREIPNANVRVVDVADPDLPNLPQIVADELYRWGLLEIGYLDGVRHTLVPQPREVAASRLNLDAGQTVLVCGGSTGIGFALASELAQRFGCQVVVTGQTPAPTGTEDWLCLDEAGFDAYRREQLRRAGTEGTLRQTRSRLHRLAQLRELHGNLRRSVSGGLRIRYVECDLTDAIQVRKLIAELSPGLVGVVYNAGMYRPARLPAKTDQDFLAGVTADITGFLRVLAAVRGVDLAFFCNAGSLTGRLGGTVGELDYAAGSEALVRLGFWAGRANRFRVMTCCWPVWHRLGTAKNPDAAVRRMPAVDPDDALDRWCAELVASGPGEVTFLGPVGQALRPVQAGHYLVERMLPGFDGVYPRVFHLGEVLHYVPSRRLETRTRFSAHVVPALGDFLVGGLPAIPVSLLLEHVLRSAEWTVPEHGPLLHPTMLTDVEIDIAALRLADGTIGLHREICGRDVNGEWLANVILRHAAGNAVARTTVRYGMPPSAPVQPATGPAVATLADPGGNPYLHWKGVTVPLAQWQRHTDGTLSTVIQPARNSELWSADPPPKPALPVSALENIVRGALAGYSATARPAKLRIAQLVGYPGMDSADLAVGVPYPGTWYAVDSRSRRVVLAVYGLRITGVSALGGSGA
ncbi:MAG TPA: KR domain-containing protein [Micromonosporaceae bacterium]|jgi:NAD(P)-dependent dehydrogenase (short-subunit alcohol dehydrogenase family)|nr:KR domain-containing protein [Micromonosporaceae bacterium]